MSESQPILDIDFIRERRLAVGLSGNALAKRLGVSIQTTRTLELEGRDHSDWSIKFLQRLADVLEVNLVDLFTVERSIADPNRTPDEDSRKVVALLFENHRVITTDAVRQTFGWDQARAVAAMRQAKQSLAGTGLIVRYGDGHNGAILKTDGESLTKGERVQHGLVRLEEDSINLSEARILQLAARDQLTNLWEKRVANSQRPFLYKVQNKQLVHRQDDRYVLDDDVIFSLGLEDLATPAT